MSPSTRGLDSATALVRAYEALTKLTTTDDALADPLVVVAYDAMRAAGETVDPRPLLRYLAGSEPKYGRTNAMRYRWGLSRDAQPGSRAYADVPHRWAHWRPGETEWLQRSPSEYGRRLVEPIILSAQFGFWGRISADPEADPEVAALARAVMDEAQPVAEHDLAALYLALDPWRDTFALWVLGAEPVTADRFRTMLFNHAMRYGAIAARDGVVCGLRHPWYRRPLVSASAQLALGLWQWAVYPSVIPGLVLAVSLLRNDDGSWNDEGQPPDVLTTLAAAELMIRVDPAFDPEPTCQWLIRRQESAGWWRALGPEVPWLTAAVARWLRLADEPFTERFAWPAPPIWTRDRMTGLPTLAAVDELGRMLAQLPRLSAAPMDVAFIDLAGFRAFNQAHGSQVEGDRVLAMLGAALRTIPGVLPARIGGDEMLVMGKPGVDLWPVLAAWRESWPATLEAERVTDRVAPRILVGRRPAGELAELRHELGDGIFAMKNLFPEVPAEGVQGRLMDGRITVAG